MSKRFSETLRFDEVWYQEMPIEFKMMYEYAWAHCDPAGVWVPNWKLAEFKLGAKIKREAFMDATREHIEFFPDGRMWIRGFIKMQCGKLSRECRPHNAVFEALERHGIPESAVDQNTAFVGSVPTYQAQRIIRRDGPVCAYSGEPIAMEDIEVDHVLARSKGGPARDENLVVASKVMNQLKGDLHIEDFCKLHHLDLEAVLERISKRTGKVPDTFRKGFSNLLYKDKEKGTVQDKEQDKDKARGTLEEIRAFCIEIGLPASDGDSCFHKWEGKGWKNGGDPIKCWRSTIRSWKAAGYMPSQKVAGSGKPAVKTYPLTNSGPAGWKPPGT